MARKPMVTRTFETMRVEVMTVDITTSTISNTIYTLSRVITDNKKLESVVRENFNEGNIKFVAIVDTKIESKLYGMGESDFLKYAVELDPETRKVLESDEDEDEDEQ